jgi:hypothetical protein
MRCAMTGALVSPGAPERPAALAEPNSLPAGAAGLSGRLIANLGHSQRARAPSQREVVAESRKLPHESGQHCDV